ncbi:MAG: hypothetical protein KDI79_27765 [Anaerolineae bacterium]|nr:hypothetical protein [Anaerolineae bacterium]
MTLLERIAESNGDPHKTIAALRLLNQRLKQELALLTAQLESDPASPVLIAKAIEIRSLGWDQCQIAKIDNHVEFG